MSKGITGTADRIEMVREIIVRALVEDGEPKPDAEDAASVTRAAQMMVDIYDALRACERRRRAAPQTRDAVAEVAEGS